MGRKRFDRRRDQAQILKTLADNNFTPESGITVNLQLVSWALCFLPLCPKRTRYRLTIGSGDVANYAFRNAAVNLREFSDFEEIAQRFSASALTPLSFDGGPMVCRKRRRFQCCFIARIF